MLQNFRLDKIGIVNRDKKISFKFNGKKYFGYKGDTLASALIANGVHLVGRSFKYHRPRGFFGAGVDEPYAIVQMNRNNPSGKHSELWHHVAGCRQWFKVSRNTITHEIFKTAKINEEL